MTKKPIDLANWNRREHFEYFLNFEEPFHGLVVNLDCTAVYQRAKQAGDSFFLHYLHLSLRAINANEVFRYRIEGTQVFDYGRINVSTTVTREDHTFGFCRILFDEDFQQFKQNAQSAMQAVRERSGLCLIDEDRPLDVIHFSTLPWIKFTGLSHARHFPGRDSVPKISVGKCTLEGDRRVMPVAINVHHGLADGYHVHRFVEYLQGLFNNA